MSGLSWILINIIILDMTIFFTSRLAPCSMLFCTCKWKRKENSWILIWIPSRSRIYLEHNNNIMFLYNRRDTFLSYFTHNPRCLCTLLPYLWTWWKNFEGRPKMWTLSRRILYENRINVWQSINQIKLYQNLSTKYWAF